MREAWINTITGELAIGESAIEQLAQQVGHVATPLQELVLGEDFPFVKGDFPRISARDTTPEETVLAGRALASLFQTEHTTVPFGRRYVDRLNILGLMPDINYIKRHIEGGLAGFCQQIGAESGRDSTRFNAVSKWTLLELIVNAHEVRSPDYPVTMREIELLSSKGLIPAYDYIIRRFESLAKMNEYLGFPDIRSWDYLDYTMYGATVLKLNGPNSLTARNFDQLSMRRLGPSTPTIVSKFGSLSTFQYLATSEFERQGAIEKARHHAVQRHFDEVNYGQCTPLADDDRLITWAKYHVAQDCLHGLDDAALTELALLENEQFIKAIIKHKPALTVADLELAALSLRVEEYIWPPTYKREPILDV